MTTIPTLPAAPLRTQEPSVFNANVEAWVQALPAWTTAANALGGEVSASATSAASSATTASNHATNAGASATNAANSATAAGTSATNAANSATAAGTSATNATNSATAAGTSATNAANSATAAGTSATNAANSATAAAGSATTASTAAAVGRASGNGVNVTLDLSSTADADPGPGKVRPNNAALASATFLYLDDADNYGNAIGAWVDTLDDSTNTIRGQIVIKNSANDALAVFNVTGAVVAGTGYRKIPVSYVGGAGTFSNNAVLGFSFARAGDRGATGPNGVVALGYSAPSSATSFAAADNSKMFKATGTWVLGSATAATLGAGWFAFFENAGTGVITGPVSSEEINPGDVLLYFSDGTTLRYTTLRRGRMWRFSSTNISGATTAVIAIPDASQVLLTVDSVTHNGGASGNFNTSPSFDGGSTFPNANTSPSAFGSGTPVFGSMLIVNPSGPSCMTVGVPGLFLSSPTGNTVQPNGGSTYSVTFWRGPNGTARMSHVRLSWTNGATITAGTATIWVP